jgi:excisionase family DNA binding protein
MLSPVLTVKEIASYLRCSRITIYKLLKRREIPAFKIGGDWRFNLEDIERWTKVREIRPQRTEAELDALVELIRRT